MQAIDIKTQISFESCASAQTIDDVNFAALDFSDEINSFIFQKGLGISLPPAIKQIVDANTSPSPWRPTNLEENASEAPMTSKRRTNAKSKPAELVGQPSKTRHWSTLLGSSEPLGAFHRGDRPPLLKGKEICLKYHLLGYCTFGATCKRKESHMDAFSEGAKAAFNK